MYMKQYKLFFVCIFMFIAFVFVKPEVSYAQSILFEDNFETDKSYQWTTIRNAWVRNFVNGSNRFGLVLNTSSSTTEAQGGDYNWTNYKFSFDILPISGIDRNVYFRVKPERSGSFWGMDVPVSYGLHMYSNRIWLQKWSVSSQSEPVTIPISLPNNFVSHFEVQLVDNNIKVFMNNNPLPIIDYNDLNNPFLSGRIALGITTGNTFPTEVWFDNVKIESIGNHQSSLKIKTHVENNNGGTLTASDFSINIGGSDQTTKTINGSENGIDVELNEGVYEITEGDHTGYKVSYSSDCSGTISAGEEKECVITNDDIAPTITLTKEIIGGTGDVNAFGMSLNGSTVSSGVSMEVSANLPIIINESGLENYEFVSITGEGCPENLGKSVTLLPGENLSCVITNRYIVPVTKVFVVPGLGASWNLDAFITCKTSGYDGSWNLAPYAESVYNPVLSVLPSKGWTVVPFYYDWRRDIRENSPVLKDLINSKIVPGEKVDILAHSMGGLVARNYLETESGGQAAKFLAVSTPNKGSSFAYPLIAGSEVWTDNLIVRIGSSLLLNHCGIPSSIYNLLPTYNYLKDSRTGQIKEVSGLAIKNNYLPKNFDYSSWNVKVGTLAGTGVPTLKLIDVTKDPKWADGKPVRKEFVNEGDGTVLTESAQINGADNQTINQSHSGVIASDEAIDKILKFFGSPGIDDPQYKEDRSALVLIGYPNNFSVTDKNGKVKNSKDGMIAIMNPESGSYRLKFTGSATSTDLIIAQFLSNGQTEYKEYKFKGVVEEKILEFDSKKTRKDILHNIGKYSEPHFLPPKFPKFWFDFWRFWGRFKR